MNRQDRSKWRRTDNQNIWKDQLGNLRDMTSHDPSGYKNGDGFKISSITQLGTFLPRNIANLRYNDPYMYHGNNPKFLHIDNEEMLLFLNKRIGSLCDDRLLSRKFNNKHENFKGAKFLFENSGDNLLFSEIQKLFCSKTCLFDPVLYYKECESHLTLEDIASIDPLTNIPGFLEELSLYDEFSQRPFPQIDIKLLQENSGDSKGQKLNNLNHGIVGQYEVRKFLIVLISLCSCLEESIDCKLGSFSSDAWHEGKLFFKSSHLGKQSGLVLAPLAEWGWGPEFFPVDNPCTHNPPCSSCVKEFKRNNKVEPNLHWMNFHYQKEECPGSETFPGLFRDHKNAQSHQKPEYKHGKYVYYCNIGACPEDCECSDCDMEATKDNNTQCKDHVPDHPENFNEELHIQYPRRMFTEKEVQKEFLPVKLPRMEKDCDVCQDNVFEHRFYHRVYHSFCNACVYMKIASEKTFDNICKYCLKAFKDKYKLRNHLGIHLELFICKLCEKQFACKQTLKKHNEEFHVEKETADYKCKVCDVRCSNARNLSAHEKTHQVGTDSNKCDLCTANMYFKHERSLRRHYLSVHKVVASYYLRPDLKVDDNTCDICGKSFGRKDNLKRHKSSNSCSILSCSYCTFFAKNEAELRTHSNISHLKCQYCNFQTIHKRNLVRHVKKQHG